MNFDRTFRANVKKGISTANHAEYANSKAFPNRIRGSGVVRVFGVFRGYKFNLISPHFRSFPGTSSYFRISGEVGLPGWRTGELTCKIRIMNFDRTCRANVKKGILTAKHANSKASPNRIRGSGVVRVFGVFRGYKFNLISPYFRGQSLLQHKLEKNGISPKTWYRPIFQIEKFNMAANQNDPAEIERNWSRKFLQFLENFSGVYPPGGGVCTRCRQSKRVAVSRSQSQRSIWGSTESHPTVSNLRGRGGSSFVLFVTFCGKSGFWQLQVN